MIENVNLLVKPSPFYTGSKKFSTPIKRPAFSENDYEALNYPSAKNMQGYIVNFGASKDNEIHKEKVDEIMSDLSAPAEEFLDEVVAVAKKFKNPEVNQLHLYYVSLNKLAEYIDLFINDEIDPNEYNHIYTDVVQVYGAQLGTKIFEDKKTVSKISDLLENEKKKLEEHFTAEAVKDVPKKTKLAKDFVNDLYSTIYSLDEEDEDEHEVNITIGDIVNAGIFNTKNFKIIREYFNPFIYKVFEATMRKDISDSAPHVDMYDSYAQNILMNLGTGTNMFVIHDDNSSQKYLETSLAYQLLSGKQFGALNKDNTQLEIINGMGNYRYLTKKSEALLKEKDKNHIIIYDAEAFQNNHDSNQILLPINLIKIMINDASNVKYVIIGNKNIYDAYMTICINPVHFEPVFESFGDLSLPIMTVDQVKKAFKQEPLLLKPVKKPFSPNAVDYVVTATASQKGNYPEKALVLMNKIATTYPNKKEISLADVKDYIKMRPDLFRTENDSSAISIAFDTGVRLKNMLGAKSTKAEITSIIKQIKQNNIGTKGFIIYPQDGYPGGGRKFSSKVIAGETKSPYLEINAMDFGTKDVELLSETASSPEKEMKSLFKMLKSQAETSAHKSAVLFIENFECFTSDRYSTEYQEKAMAQLLREMDNAQKQGLNIIVIGSVSSDGAIGEATMKSFKFVDKIEVESVAYNLEARIEIIKNYLKNNHIGLDASSDAEKDELLKNFGDTTNYFAFIELMTLMGKVKNLLKERNHKALNKLDFIEAYLQLISGRPASYNMIPSSKKIVTSHECGHALNLAVMYDLAKKHNIPWHLPNKVNFIALDPRSNYMGAMHPKASENTDEYSFEKIFAEVVCDYGGHSCEKILYNMDGSWGITADLVDATKSAYDASSIMGQGYNYGKRSLVAAPFVSDDAKQDIDKDVKIMTENALKVSDLIVETYKDFILEFTDKYSDKVGSGDCIITSEEFETMLANWKNMQPADKQANIAELESIISKIINASKNGQIYKIEK